MKKIEKHIIGFQTESKLLPSTAKIERMGWYCNAINPLNRDRIPDHYDITFHDPNKNEIITSIYKDTSDSNTFDDGTIKRMADIPKSPKYQQIEQFNKNGLLIKKTKFNNSKEDNFTQYSYDSNGNLILLEYNRLGYVQYKMEYEHDSFGNITKLIHSEDESHGNQQFVVISESYFEYKFEDNAVKRDNFKLKDSERIHRESTLYEFNIEGEITAVKMTSKYVKTNNESIIWKKYDKFSNPIENYSYQNETIHPHSMKYIYTYDNRNNWVKRERKNMNDLLTLLTERRIEY